MLIALCCDPADKHRRKVWEGWTSKDGRCGRWSRVLALGVSIRAWPADKLNEFTIYRQPASLERRTRPAPWPHSSQEYFVDPEDPDYEPLEPEEPKRRIRQLAR